MLYIPERKSYLLFGGDDNTVMHYLNRGQAKHGAMPLEKKPDIKNNAIYLYDISNS